MPRQPKTTFNVGRVGGGTSVNAIPFEAWMEVDMRSADPAALKDRGYAIPRRRSSRRWRKRTRGGTIAARSRASAELVGVRPAGQTAKESAIVQTAMAVSRAMQIEEVLREGSTDSNVPMNLKIPAITISGGGSGHRGALAE